MTLEEIQADLHQRYAAGYTARRWKLRHTWQTYESTTNQHRTWCSARRSRRYRTVGRIRYWLYQVTMGRRWVCK